MVTNPAPVSGAPAGHYKNFSVALYVRSYEIVQLKDPAWRTAQWTAISQQCPVDKVYLEMHRDTVLPDEETVEQVKRFFVEQGVKVSAGIAAVYDEKDSYRAFCYTTEAQRQIFQRAVELSARHFDELMLDDFFYTNCKCDSCIRAKGGRSWEEFRLALMEEVARDLVVGPARKVNPGIRLILKFPNWYQHFAGCGYNLEKCPPLFDEIYTGSETRDAVASDQHLPPYQSYGVMRYFANVKPGHNHGGWIDTHGLHYADRYAEQLWLTLFARQPEITLFDWRWVSETLAPRQRASWQGRGTSFDYDALLASLPAEASGKQAAPLWAGIAGQAFAKVDPLLGRLGQPLGVAVYNPYHAVGEDYLPSFLGGIGIPIEMTPEFPAQAKHLLLCEAAAADAQIVAKITERLAAGATVVMTSGLLHALQDRGLADVAELRMTGHVAAVRDFFTGSRESIVHGERTLLLPQLRYLTNDAREMIGALTETGLGYPLLTRARYGAGQLFVLTIPETFSDLYVLPAATLNLIRAAVAAGLFVRLEGPGEVSLFVYDNGTCIVQSFRDEPVTIQLILDGRYRRLTDVAGGGVIPRTMREGEAVFAATVPPHSYRVFAAE